MIFDKSFRLKRIHLRKFILILIVLNWMSAESIAQGLEYLPPVLNSNVNRDTAVSLLVGTMDFAKYENHKETVPYSSTIQIIDVNQPWPPRWYTATPGYTQEMYDEDRSKGEAKFNIICSPLIGDDYLSFAQLVPIPQADTNKSKENQIGFLCFMVNKKMEIVDTIKSRIFYGGKYSPDYRKNDKIEMLLKVNRQDNIDFHNISGDPRDSVVETTYNVIQILDHNDKVVFEWNPTKQINPNSFPFKDRLQKSTTRLLRYTEINSSFWDYDGNILVSIEEIGICKISRSDGHTIWSLNQNEMPVIFGKDTLKLYGMRDFRFLQETDSSVIYTLYAGKSGDSSYAKAVIFERNKTTGSIRIIKYMEPRKKYEVVRYGFSDYDLKTKRYTIDYGVFDEADSSKQLFRDAFEYGREGNMGYVYQLPKWNNSLGMQVIENWPRPPRPKIIKQGQRLEAVGDFKEWTWYKLEGPHKTKVTKVDTGSSLKPENGATYCVVSPYGIGYSVSKPFLVKF